MLKNPTHKVEDDKSHGDGCYCECCMAADSVWELRRNLAEMEASLEQLCKAQRVSAADLIKTIDARRRSCI